MNSETNTPDAGSGGDAAMQYVMVPKPALDWLHGLGTDFSCPPELYRGGRIPPYWWRKEFERRCAEYAARQPVGVKPIAFADLANWKAGLDADECFFTDWQDDDTVPVYTAPPAPAAVPVDVRDSIASISDEMERFHRKWKTVGIDEFRHYAERIKFIADQLATHPQPAADGPTLAELFGQPEVRNG